MSQHPDLAGAEVVIAVLTYRRPGLLRAALPMLMAQARSIDPPARVLVVDNDPRASGVPVATEVGGDLVCVVHEAEPGIAAARNRALDEVGDRGCLVFIDDDEVPGDDWLRELVALYRQGDVGGVVGPVLPSYEVNPPAWILAGRYFEHDRHPTGHRVEAAATNNLLLDLAAVSRLDLRFDARYSVTGGSDTHFTRRLVAAGYPIVWCDEAVVYDRLPAQRLTKRWVLARHFRAGVGTTRVAIDLASTGPSRAAQRMRHVARGLIRLLGGALRWTTGLLTGNLALRARSARTMVRGLGMVAGAFGYAYRAYRRD